MPRTGKGRVRTQLQSPRCGVNGIQTSEPEPACGGASRRTNETYDAVTVRFSPGASRPSWLWLRARRRSRPDPVELKPRDST